jgi:hypothetical protein
LIDFEFHNGPFHETDFWQILFLIGSFLLVNNSQLMKQVFFFFLTLLQSINYSSPKNPNISFSQYFLKEGEFPEGWSGGDSLDVTDTQSTGNTPKRACLTTNESQTRKNLGFVLLSSSVPLLGSETTDDLETICIKAERFDGKGDNYVRMDNLFSYIPKKFEYEKCSGTNGKIDAEEFYFKLSYVIGNVENNFNPPIDKNQKPEPIHYGKLFFFKKYQYIVVLSPNLICYDQRKAFNWVVGAHYSKNNNEMELIETRRYQKDFLLKLDEKKKSKITISKDKMKKIRQDMSVHLLGITQKQD